MLQAVSISCSEIRVLHRAKTGFSHASADEQRFTDGRVMTRTAETRSGLQKSVLVIAGGAVLCHGGVTGCFYLACRHRSKQHIPEWLMGH